MRIAQEEIFGPVISAIAFEDVDDAVAHRQRLHLRPVRLGLDRRRRASASTSPSASAPAPINVNGFMLEPCAPFGGFKQSGVGREGGPEGLAAYLEDKAINRF